MWNKTLKQRVYSIYLCCNVNTTLYNTLYTNTIQYKHEIKHKPYLMLSYFYPHIYHILAYHNIIVFGGILVDLVI